MASRSLATSSRSRSRTPALLDPFRLMNSLLGDVVSTRPSDGAGTAMLLAQPRMNIDDTGNEIRVTAELPGVSEDDVQITLDDDMLIIAGEKRDEREVDDRDARLVERVFGQFRRVIQLPFSPNPDQVEADFLSGVRSGVNGTPCFFINGVRHDGSYAAADLAASIAAAQQKARPQKIHIRV